MTRRPMSLTLRREGFGSLARMIRSMAALVEVPLALLNLSTISSVSGDNVIVVLRGAGFLGARFAGDVPRPPARKRCEDATAVPMIVL